MRACELVSELSKLPMPCVEGRRHQEHGVGRYVATVRVGGQLARTVVYADSTVHARLLLQYKYGMKSIAVAPVQIDESTVEDATSLFDGVIKPAKTPEQARINSLKTNVERSRQQLDAERERQRRQREAERERNRLQRLAKIT
jgi:hypothetical protein